MNKIADQIVNQSP